MNLGFCSKFRAIGRPKWTRTTNRIPGKFARGRGASKNLPRYRRGKVKASERQRWRWQWRSWQKRISIVLAASLSALPCPRSVEMETTTVAASSYSPSAKTEVDESGKRGPDRAAYARAHTFVFCRAISGQPIGEQRALRARDGCSYLHRANKSPFSARHRVF